MAKARTYDEDFYSSPGSSTGKGSPRSSSAGTVPSSGEHGPVYTMGRREKKEREPGAGDRMESNERPEEEGTHHGFQMPEMARSPMDEGIGAGAVSAPILYGFRKGVRSVAEAGR